MSPNTLPDLRAHEYQQRQEAHRLRRLLHEQSDPDAFEEVLDELLKAESKLSGISGERAVAQQADPKASGQILDNTAHDPAYLGVETTGLETKVHPVPEEIDRDVARLKLNSMGIDIDQLTPEQKRYLTSWEQGT